MISDKYKCIFVEVPKTGTTSIRSIIGQPPKPHLNISQIANKVNKEKFNTYFKFGFVRNPWDRVVSLYERKEGQMMKSKMSFDEFVDWIKLSSSTCINPLPHRYQLDWFLNANGEVIVDFIGRFESLNEDWLKVGAQLGIDQELPKLNKNRARKKHYTDYYTDKTKTIIGDKFARDIEYFEYSYGN